MRKLYVLLMALFVGFMANAQTTITVGNGTSASVASDNSGPVYRSSNTSSFNFSRHDMLYKASDLAALPAGTQITKIAWYKTTAFTISGTNTASFQVLLKNSSAASLSSSATWGTATAGTSAAFTGTLTAADISANAGWVTLNLTTPFIYTGGSLEVLTDWAISGTSPYTTGAFQWQYTTSSATQSIGYSNSAALTSSTVLSSPYSRLMNLQLTFVTATACSGTPTAGTISGPSSICNGVNFTLSNAGATTGVGSLKYAWQSSTDNLTWTDVAGQTSPSGATLSQSVATYYRFVDTCSASNQTSISNVVQVTMNAPATCYCTPVYTTGCSSSDQITNFVLNTLSNNSGTACQSTTPIGYTVYPSSSFTTILAQTSTYSANISIGSGGAAGVAIWIDYNDNGLFEASEKSYTSSNISASSAGTITVTVPASAPLGPHRMRVRHVYSTAGTSIDPCASYTYGETEDYTITVAGPPACASPTAQAATSITPTSALLSWTAPATPPSSYEIYYSTTNTAPTGSTVPTITGVATTSQAITGLTSATTYYAWVRSNCGAGLVSSWSGSAVSFTTPCPAVNIPYTQNFNSVTAPAIPGCTVVENANADAQTWRTVSSISGVASVTSNALGYQYSSTLAANDWYFIQALSLTAGNSYTLRFKYLASSAPTYVEKLKVVLGTAQQSSAMTGAVLFNNNNITNTGYVEAVVDFTVPTSGDYVIGFQAYSAADRDFLVIDDIGVDITPLCATPTAVNATNVTTTGVTLNWTAPAATPAGYEIYYSTTNTAPTGSTVPTVTGVATTSQAISGLNNATTYYAWVRSNCGRGLVSDWSGSPITFATACGILNIPYVQDFNTVTLPAVPYCTLVENTNADANTWKTIAAGSTTAITSIALDYSYNSTTAANDWFFTPKLNLSAGTNYTLRFKYLATNSSYPEKFKVVTGTDQTSASMTGATLFNATGIANTSYKDTSIVFTIPTSGAYVFGFQVYSDADEDNLVIDDISIDVTPLCATPTAPTVSNLLTTSGTLTWSGTGSYLLEYGAAGFTPGTGITAGTGGTLINPATSPVNITGLTLSTAYDVYVRQNCTSSGNGYSANTAKLSFTTPAFDNDNASGAVTLTHTMYSSACTGTVYSTVGATASSETSTCFSASQDDDVWFKFVATDTKAILKLSNYTTASGTPGTFYYGIYSGTPGTLAEVNCDLSSVVSTTNGGGEIYIPAVLNVGTTYYIRALTGGTGGRATFNLCVMSPDVSANTTANTCVAAQTFDISGGLTTLWVPLFMADGKLVGEINANGNTLGSTTVKVYRNTNAVRKDFYNKSYLDRNIEITPTTQPTSGTVSVRLYFTNAELVALQNDPGSQVTSSSDLGVFKNSQSCAATVGAGAAPVAGATTTSYGSNYYIGFDVSSFSTFYVASKNFASLPANILTFSGLRQGAANNLKWTVAQETDVQVYGIERSEDGNRWSTVGTVNSLGNTTQQRSYTFSDNNISGLKQLYRLRQTDRNGSVKISNTIVINGTKATLLTLSGLFPNPASGKVNLLVDAPVKDNITIVVMDAVGRIVKTQKAAVDAGSNTLEVNVASLAGGSYLMKLTCDGNCQSAVSKFVKE